MDTAPELSAESNLRNLSFPQRIAFAAKIAGNATELARKTGISRRAIGTYLSGSSDPTLQRLLAIADATGIALEWLATGAGPIFTQHKTVAEPCNRPSGETPDYVIVPQKEMNLDVIGCNDGKGPIKDACDLAFHPAWLTLITQSKTEDLIVFSLKASYPLPFGLSELVLVDKHIGPVHELNGVYIIESRGMICLRRITSMVDDRVELVGVDPAYPTIRNNRDLNGFKILGKVVWTGGRTCSGE
ncbi:MAG: helix-turn-helix domain-containing protein [Pseudomonadota bacterium]